MPPICSARLRVHELRSKSKSDLMEKVRRARSAGRRRARLTSRRPQLKELKTELANLRVAKVTGGAPNKLSKMCGCSARPLRASVADALPSS
jgi:large subunit ribosomal protein L35e